MENRKRLTMCYDQVCKLTQWVKVQSASASIHNFDFNDFYNELNKSDYCELRETLYFYEYIGSLVKMHEISFKQIFSLIYFPDDLNNDLSYLMSKVQNMKSDFLENYCYLRKKFEKSRDDLRKIRNTL